jgi:release factor glutamine methyltransferase
MAMPLLLDLVRRSGTWLLEKGIANGPREAEWIFMEALQLSRLDLYTSFDRPLEPAEVDRVRALVARRGKREPLAYILGHQPFVGLDLLVNPAVLVPRPETESLIPLLIADLPQGGRLIDIGTGSGAIALAVAQARPDAQVEASDLHPAALAVAQANAARHQLKVTFHAGHLARERSGPYAVIAANLPYIGTTEQAECDPELAFEPATALYCGPDGLGLIAELIQDAPRLLSPAGVLWLEHGHRQGPAITALATAAGLRCTVRCDDVGRERFARISRG